MPARLGIQIFSIAWLIIPLAPDAGAQVPLPNPVGIFDGTTLYQSVTVSVQAINLVAVSGNVTLAINAATPGSAPDSDADSSTSYDLTVNSSGKKITAYLDAAFSSGITLRTQLTAPSGASSTARDLTTTPQDLVTGIGGVATTGLTITHTASATPEAAPNGAGQSRTVTYTLTDE